MTTPMAAGRVPPIWLLGLSTFSNGAFTGILLVTIPQLLAARGIAEPKIAQVTSVAMIPGVFAFLVAPVLDLRFSRRTYAVVLAIVQAAMTALALNALDDLPLLTACLLISNVGYNLFTPAVAGWFGGVIERRDEPRLGAWLAAGSIIGFGLMSAMAIPLLRLLPYHLGITVLVAAALGPLLVFPFVPSRLPDRRLANEGFGTLARGLLDVLRNRHVLRLMVLFALPAATFALTNALGGLGKDFGASEQFAGLIGGLGAAVGCVFGALVAPSLARRFSLLTLYILIGLAGALFTLCLSVPHRTPALFAVAMVGENVFQSAAFAVVNALALLSIGKDNPFAATQFALIYATVAVPITYMQFVSGRAYGWGGLHGTFFADAGMSIVACLVMAAMFATRWRDSVTPRV